MRALRLALAFALAAAAASSLGCAAVKPWERDLLAKPEMTWSPDPLEAALDAHTYFSKEASLPGGGGGGGGCGCN